MKLGIYDYSGMAQDFCHRQHTITSALYRDKGYVFFTENFSESKATYINKTTNAHTQNIL
jgi:hypothetical protein